MEFIISAACLIVGCIAGFILFRYVATGKYRQIIAEAGKEAEVIKKKKLLEVKEKFLNKKAELEKEVQQRNQQIQQHENRLKQRELNLNQRQDDLNRKRNDVENDRKRLENPDGLQRITVPCLMGWSGSHAAVPRGGTFLNAMAPGIRYTVASESGLTTVSLIISSGCSALRPNFMNFHWTPQLSRPTSTVQVQKRGASKRDRAQPGRRKFQNTCSCRRLWLSGLSDA